MEYEYYRDGIQVCCMCDVNGVAVIGIGFSHGEARGHCEFLVVERIWKQRRAEDDAG